MLLLLLLSLLTSVADAALQLMTQTVLQMAAQSWTTSTKNIKLHWGQLTHNREDTEEWQSTFCHHQQYWFLIMKTPTVHFFLSSMNTDSHQHRANTEREAQLNVAGSLCSFPCSLCHKALRWDSAGKALLGENKWNVDKEKVNSSWIMMSYALNLWLLEIHTLLSCYLSPLVWDTQCHRTTEFYFLILHSLVLMWLW